VRVIKIGDFSTELCGGTHTGQTGEIGLIKILKEGSVSSGVRRVEAVTGEGSLQHFRKDHALEEAARTLVPQKRDEEYSELHPDGTMHRIRETSVQPLHLVVLQEFRKKEEEIKRLARELDAMRMKSASTAISNIEERIKEVNGVKVLVHRADNLERTQIRTLTDQLRAKVGDPGVVVLGSVKAGRVSINVAVSPPLSVTVSAGSVIAPIAAKVGGKGGGRPDLAEAGGKDPGALDAALGEVYGVVKGLLNPK